jgi:hypothetical protein
MTTRPLKDTKLGMHVTAVSKQLMLDITVLTAKPVTTSLSATNATNKTLNIFTNSKSKSAKKRLQLIVRSSFRSLTCSVVIVRSH